MTACRITIPTPEPNRSENISTLSSSHISPHQKCSSSVSLVASILVTNLKSFLKAGTKTQNYLPTARTIKSLIYITYSRVNHCRSGKQRVGYTPMIHAAGFSGTAATTSEGATKTTHGKLHAGRPSHATLRKSSTIADPATKPVDRASAKRFSSGRTTRGNSKFCMQRKSRRPSQGGAPVCARQPRPLLARKD